MIWLIGNNGMLGSEISRQLKEHKFDFTGTDRNVDITDPAALEAFAESYTNADGTFSFDWIINCSAYTAVDRAEDDEVSAEKLNADGPRNIARVAQKIGAKLLHLSTDYVFDGTGSRPYRETDGRKPIGVYGRTKAAGEQAVLDLIPGSSYIIRTAWLAGYDGNNFVYTMTRLMNSRDTVTVVSDQHGTPTFAEDLASVIIGIIQRDRNGAPVPCGIYHCTDLGETTWYEFARAIYEKGRDTGRITKTCRVLPCTTAGYPTKAQRPAYSVLDKTKIQHALGITLPRWQDSLDRFMKSSRFRLPEK
jgi:dTDP-4-dehydrorhamnose reductase